jgi:hypothetical protein
VSDAAARPLLSRRRWAVPRPEGASASGRDRPAGGSLSWPLKKLPRRDLRPFRLWPQATCATRRTNQRHPRFVLDRSSDAPHCGDRPPDHQRPLRRLATGDACVRGLWEMENRLYWYSNFTCEENKSPASPRRVAISRLLLLHGQSDIAAVNRTRPATFSARLR